MVLAGFLPFCTIYMQLHYMLMSMWGNRVYTLYSTIFVIFIILLITISLITVALTHFQLAAKDHRWWWSYISLSDMLMYFRSRSQMKLKRKMSYLEMLVQSQLITDMEKYKQEFHELHRDSQSYLMLARDLHRKLLAARRRIEEQRITQKNKMFREISEAAAAARSMLHKRVREFRASQVQHQPIRVGTTVKSLAAELQQSLDKESKDLVQRKSTIPSKALRQSSSEKKSELPAVGAMIHVPSLGRKATVLKVDCSKKEIVVQAGNMKMKLKLDKFRT